MSARWCSEVAAIVLAITLTSGCKASPSTAAPTQPAATQPAATQPGATQGTPARPQPATYPNPSPTDACPDRVDVAMTCFDLGAAADCGQVIAARKAALKDRDAACRTSLLETCTLGCSLGHGGKESRDHFLMLMTSPPP